MGIIKRLSKGALNVLPHQILYKQGAAKNIVVFASRRGGSTILYEILSIDKSTRKIYEPFVFHPSNPATPIKIRKLPRKPHDIYIDLNDSEQNQIKVYLNNLFNGKYQEFKYYFSATRTVLKTINGLALIDFIGTNFNVQPIYMSRHPIAQSLSIMRNNWHITNEAYLKSQRISSILDPNQYYFSKKIDEKGTYFQRCILNWCLDNLIPLYHTQLDTLVRLTYEELVSEPEKTINFLSEKFNIVDISRMKQAISKVSSSSTQISTTDTQSWIQSGNNKKLITGWKDKINPNQKEQCQEILDKLDFDIYNADKVMPASKYLLF